MKNIKIYLIGLVLLAAGIFIGKQIDGNHSRNDTATENKAEKQVNKVEHWTCSMHPQIDLPEPGQCPICGMDLIPKTDDNQSQSKQIIKLTSNAMALANIETITVGEDALTAENNGIRLSGKIAVNTSLTSVQAAHFGGRIEKLYYQSEGDLIRKGNKIALLYSPELVTAQNELLEAMYVKNEQPELYNAVRNKLKNWKLSEKQIQRIENSKKVITNFPMYADKNGYVLKVLVENGNHVKEGTPMFQLADLRKVWAVLDVYEKDLPNIRQGQKVEITLNAYPGKTFEGTVGFIDPVVNEKTRTVQVRVDLPNKNNLLKPGMLAEGKIKVNKTASGKQVIRIPKSAILWTGKRSVVYVKVNPDKPDFEMREVELGVSAGDYYEILSGLKPGEEIVYKGTFTVDASAQLQGKKSMMNMQGNETAASIHNHRGKQMNDDEMPDADPSKMP